jgi:hypothetical protein
MVRRSLLPGAVAAALAFVLGYVFGGYGVAWSAFLGIAVAVANFAAGGWALAWASTVSLATIQLVVLCGFIVRLGIVVGVMAVLSLTDWFSPTAFGLAVAPAWLALMVFEAALVARGLGQELLPPPDAGDAPGAPGAVRVSGPSEEGARP